MSPSDLAVLRTPPALRPTGRHLAVAEVAAPLVLVTDDYIVEDVDPPPAVRIRLTPVQPGSRRTSLARHATI